MARAGPADLSATLLLIFPFVLISVRLIFIRSSYIPTVQDQMSSLAYGVFRMSGYLRIPTRRVREIHRTRRTCPANSEKCPAKGLTLPDILSGECISQTSKCPAKALIFSTYFTVKCPARIQNVRRRTGSLPDKMSGEAQTRGLPLSAFSAFQ